MQLGSGYKLHIPGSTRIPNLGFPTTYIHNESVLEIPNSAGAANAVSELEEMGYSDIVVNGLTIEDVFLDVADEARPTEEGKQALSEYIIANLLIIAESKGWSHQNEGLSAASEVSSWRQVRIPFMKRWTILLRNWWPYLVVLIIPTAATPPLRAILRFYHIPACIDTTADVHPVQPLNIPFVSQFTSLQLLTGPPSINETLYNVVSNFPIGQGVNLQNYSNEFVFEASFDSFQQHLATQYANVSPRGLYLDSHSTAPTYAFLGDSGILTAMLMQNLWTQIRTGIPIAVYFTFFNSLVSVLCSCLIRDLLLTNLIAYCW